MTRQRVHKLSLQASLSLSIIALSIGLFSRGSLAQSAAASASSPVPLPGAIDCRTSLKNIEHAARHITQATLDIVNDVEQRKLAATPGDPLIDNPPDNNVKDEMVWSQQMSEMGPLEQPKPQWLDADVSHLEKWLSMLNQDFTATTFGAGQKDAASATWNEMEAVVRDMNSHFKQLQQLSVGPHFDNLEIGKAALRIHDDVSKLEKPLRDTLKNIQSVGQPGQ
jgi:hypothetical protein